MTHADTSDTSSTELLPLTARRVIYLTATPIGAASAIIAGTHVFGEPAAIIAGAIGAACASLIGGTALAHPSR